MIENVNTVASVISQYTRVDAVNSSQLQQTTVVYKEINGKQVSEVQTVLYTRYGVVQGYRAPSIDVIA